MKSTLKKQFILSDQFIRQMADLLCLSMATNTNIGDHFRLIKVEESQMPGMEGKLVLTEEYVNQYNKHIVELTAEMEKQAEALKNSSAEA